MILRGAIIFAGAAITAFGPALAWAEILIAIAGLSTGQNIVRGEQFQQDADAAVVDINAGGGRPRALIFHQACDIGR